MISRYSAPLKVPFAAFLGGNPSSRPHPPLSTQSCVLCHIAILVLKYVAARYTASWTHCAVRAPALFQCFLRLALIVCVEQDLTHLLRPLKTLRSAIFDFCAMVIVVDLSLAVIVSRGVLDSLDEATWTHSGKVPEVEAIKNGSTNAGLRA